MSYGTIKIDTITFTDGGIDKSVSVSGLTQNPTFSGNITVTGTVSGNTIQGVTVSGVTGTFTSGVFASGTAAAPSVSIGTTDNGLYSPGTDQVAISTNGTGRLFVDASGNIGFKTSSPRALVDFGAGTGHGALNQTVANYQAVFESPQGTGNIARNIAFAVGTNGIGAAINAVDDGGSDATGLIIATGTAGSISERLRITSDGKLGLGTSTPGSFSSSANQLVVGSGSGANGITIFSGNTSASNLFFSDGAGAPNIGFIQYEHVTDALRLGVNNSTRLYINSSGNVGIGTTTVARGPLHLNASADTQLHMTNSTTGTSDGDGFTIAVSGSEALLVQRESAPLSFYTASTERARIDSSGRLLVGTSSSRSVAATVGSRLQVEHQASAGVHGLSVVDTNDSAQIAFGTNNGGSVCADGKLLARINFSGNDGTDMQNQSAWIEAYADATWGNDDVPGRLVFSTTADGANSPTERMRISSDGSVSISTGGSGFSTLFRYGANEDNFISQGASGNTVFRNHNNSEYARIDSSGRLGLGTSSPGSLLDVNGQLRVRGDNNDRNPGSVFLTSGGQFTIIPGSGATSFAINDSGNTVSRFVIDSSGNVGIGTTSPSNTLQVGATTSASSTSPVSMSLGGQYTPDASITYSNLKLKVYDAGTDAGGFTAGQTNGLCAVSPANSPITFITQASDSTLTERMRITSDGGCDHFNTNSDPGLQVANSQGAGASYQAIQVRHSATTFDTGTVSFLVFTNGNVQNTNNSYGAISDAKLKENIVDASSQWNDLKALQVRNYNFKPETNQQTHTQIGLIAQEVELVSPGLVSESPDRDEDGNDLGTVTKSVNYSVLYMKAVKALQEAMERIEILEASNANLVARVTALEAQ